MNKASHIKRITLAMGIVTGFLFCSVVFAQTDGYLRTSKYTQQINEIRKNALSQARQMREASMERIREINDQKKQEAAKNIANQFERINQVWTDHFTNVLDKLEEVLNRIELKADAMAARGEDVSLVKTEIENAKEKISAARAVVIEQAKKTYIVDATLITGGGFTTAGQNSLISQLRVQFKGLRDRLSGDLKTIRDVVMKESRQAVQDALQELSKLPDVDNPTLK